MASASTPTLREVARLAGVSIATASRTLNDHPDVSAKARQAVQEAVKRLRYHPDPLLRALGRYRWPAGRRSRTPAIGHLVDRWTATGRAKAEALRVRAAGLGYQVERALLERTGDCAEIAARFLARGVGGLIVDLHGDEAHADLPWERFSGVVVGEGQTQLQLPRLSTDWLRVYASAVDHLVARGCRRIGFIVRRYAGSALTSELLVAAHGAKGTCTFAAPAILVVGIDREAAIPDLRRWLREERPDGIIGDGTGHLRTLLELGLEVPGRGSYLTTLQGGVALDGLTVSGFEADLPDRIRRAMDILHGRLLHDERGPVVPGQRLLFGCTWHPGRTLAGAPLNATESG